MSAPAAELAAAVIDGDRRALARAITLVESTRSDHRAEAAELLDALVSSSGRATRVGISGAPGVGKSTFIEALGIELADSNHRVAVLAVDPSSRQSGGSILGDKTRMEELSRHPNAYIRPSPSGGALGGLARRTREAIVVCEAAGFDAILVETVGVGQSETEVADVVDEFVLLISPAGGDELQGIKRGITELADIVVITKADGDMVGPAQQAAADYAHALHLIRRRHADWDVPVLTCSSSLRTGIGEVWDAITKLESTIRASGELESNRRAQAVAWLWAEVTDTLVESFRSDSQLSTEVTAVETAVANGFQSPLSGARTLLDLQARTERDWSC